MISLGGILVSTKILLGILRMPHATSFSTLLPFGPRPLDDIGGADGGASLAALVFMLMEHGQCRGELTFSLLVVVRSPE